MRYPLIDMKNEKGQDMNNGSIDGDAPAAMRYTEAKLSKIGEALLTGIDEDTVVFKDNYDSTEKEPDTLPGLIPNLLGNGTDGIAVGMATSIPPHNLKELYDACIHIIKCSLEEKEYTIEDLMNIIKGPDLPYGGTIISLNDYKKAFTTGKGRVTVRAKYVLEKDSDGYDVIKVTELPYQVNRARLIQKITNLSESGEIEGIKDILYKNGTETYVDIQITLKKGTNISLVLNQLFKRTELQTNISYNIMTLVDKVPRQLGIPECLDYFILHGIDVITRRSNYRINKLRNKLLILEAIMKVIEKDVDKAIKFIRFSENSIEDLMEYFDLSQAQAKYIDDMKIKQLSNKSIEKTKIEIDNISFQIDTLQEILDNPYLKLEELVKEFESLKEKFGDDRRTDINLINSDITDEDLIKDEDLIVTLTSDGNIKAVDALEYSTQKRGGKGSKAGNSIKDTEIVTDVFSIKSKDDLLFITDKGKAHCIKGYKLPKVSKTSKGKNIVNYIHLLNDENLITTINTRLNKSSKSYLLFLTKLGKIKKLETSKLSTRFISTKVMGLADNDELVSAIQVNDNDEIIICTSNGLGTRFNVDNIRPSGRNALGVIGIRINENDSVVGMTKIEPESKIMTITENALGKKTDLNKFTTAKNKGGKGYKVHEISERTGKLTAVLSLKDNETILISSTDNNIIRIHSDNISISDRATTGSKLINLKSNTQIATASVAPINLDESEED